MNCLIYLRVSTKEQAEGGYSIPAQREACLKFIREKNWVFVDEYADRGESARTRDRPQLQEMLSRVRNEKNIDVLIVHRIDRLARNLEDHVAIKAILKRSDTALVSVVENIEDSASGRFLEGIHALMAEYYSSNLASEVKKGMLQKAKSGGCPARAPVGYDNVREAIGLKSHARIVVNDTTAPLVHSAFRLYASGNYSLSEIQEILERKGLRIKPFRSKPPKALTRAGVANMLANKFYAGIVTFKGVEYQGEHTTFIDKALFQRVQNMLRSRDHAGERKRKHPHYLKGTLFCGECGSKLSYLIAKGKYPYFYCLGQKRHNNCTQPYFEADSVEAKIEDLYKGMKISADWREKIETHLEEEMIARTADSLKERKALTATVDDLTGKKYKLIEAYYAEAITLDMMKAEQMRLGTEIMLAEERLRTLDTRAEGVQKVLGMAITMADRCPTAYIKAQPETRRLFNQAFFEGIHVKDHKIQKAQYTELFADLFSPSSHKATLVGDSGFEPLTACL